MALIERQKELDEEKEVKEVEEETIISRFIKKFRNIKFKKK